MPRKKKGAAEAVKGQVLPAIPKELIEQFVSGPMSAEAVNAASIAFKKALIERALADHRMPCAGAVPAVGGQLIEGHGIYFKDPIEIEARGMPTEQFSVAKLLKLAAFAEMFGQNEYAFELLEWIIARQRRLGDDSGEALAQSVLTAAESRYRAFLGGWAPLGPHVPARTGASE